MDKIEELLKPRFKVIAPYPGDHCPVGYVYKDYSKHQYSFFNQYPHLFKPLQWWEDREEKGMPEYVKSNSDGKVYRVDKWEIGLSNSYFKIPVGNGYRTLVASAHLPTTESEYLNQNKIN